MVYSSNLVGSLVENIAPDELLFDDWTTIMIVDGTAHLRTMDLTRRRLFAALAGGSSLPLLVGTDSVSRVGAGHTANIDTSDDESYLSLDGAALREPVAESEATITMGSRLQDVTVTTLDASAFAFDPTPPISLEEPVTVEILLTDAQPDVVTDTVTIEIEGPSVRAVVEQDLHVEGQQGVDSSPSPPETVAAESDS